MKAQIDWKLTADANEGTKHTHLDIKRGLYLVVIVDGDGQARAPVSAYNAPEILRVLNSEPPDLATFDDAFRSCGCPIGERAPTCFAGVHHEEGVAAVEAFLDEPDESDGGGYVSGVAERCIFCRSKTCNGRFFGAPCPKVKT